MKLAICLMLASIIPHMVSSECECNFPDRYLKGTLSYWEIAMDKGKIVHVNDVKDQFYVDLEGYYCRSYMNHPFQCPMHRFADDRSYVVCFEKSSICDRYESIENMIFPFSKCVYAPANYSNGVYTQTTDILGVKFDISYGVTMQANGTCKPNWINWQSAANPDTHYNYSDVSVDVQRDRSFYLEEIKEFPQLTIDPEFSP